MSKAILAAPIMEAADCSRTEASDTVDAITDKIISTLKTTGKFVWPGLGTFTVRERKATAGVNPRTGVPMQISAMRVLKFKAVSSTKAEFSKLAEAQAVAPVVAAEPVKAAKPAKQATPLAAKTEGPGAAKTPAAALTKVPPATSKAPLRRAKAASADSHASH